MMAVAKDLQSGDIVGIGDELGSQTFGDSKEYGKPPWWSYICQSPFRKIP